MFREVRKKLVILGNRKPFKKETMDFMIDLQKKNWLAMNMRLDGRQVTDQDLDDILNEKLPNLLVDDYLYLRDLEWLYDQMILWQRDGHRLTRAMMDRMYETISKEEHAEPRKIASPVLEWSYSPYPMSPVEISKELEDVVMLEYETVFDTVGQAVRLHNSILRLMPYKAYNQVIARAAMLYYLMSRDMPLAFFDMKEEEYNEALAKELNHPSLSVTSHTGRIKDENTVEASAIYEPLAKGILATLNLIDNLTAEY